MNNSLEQLGIDLTNFDHEDLFTFLEQQEDQPAEDRARVFLETFLYPFHRLSLAQKWNIYALGGYEHGVENLVPFRETQKAILAALNIQSGSQVAIFGTGTGPLEREIFEQGINFGRMEAFDGDPGMLAIHQRRFGDRVNGVLQDLNEPVRTDTTFDRFTAINTLELLNISAFLQNLQKVLAPNAKGVIVTPREGIKTSIPVSKGHLEACGIEMPAGFWEEIMRLAEEIWDELFSENTPRTLDEIDGKKVQRFIFLYAKVSGGLADSIPSDLLEEQKKTIAHQFYIMGLFNAIPPVKVNILPRAQLYEYFENAGFSIESSNPINTGLSDLIVVNKI